MQLNIYSKLATVARKQFFFYVENWTRNEKKNRPLREFPNQSLTS